MHGFWVPHWGVSIYPTSQPRKISRDTVGSLAAKTPLLVMRQTEKRGPTQTREGGKGKGKGEDKEGEDRGKEGKGEALFICFASNCKEDGGRHKVLKVLLSF